MFVIKISIFFARIVFYSNGISWSNWTSCSESENCHLKSNLECDKGKGIQCAPAQRNDYTYQTRISSDCNETCDGHKIAPWDNTQKAQVKSLKF